MFQKKGRWKNRETGSWHTCISTVLPVLYINTCITVLKIPLSCTNAVTMSFFAIDKSRRLATIITVIRLSEETICCHWVSKMCGLLGLLPKKLVLPTSGTGSVVFVILISETEKRISSAKFSNSLWTNLRHLKIKKAVQELERSNSISCSTVFQKKRFNGKSCWWW